MLIIPAIDILDGRCVRLAQGDYGRQIPYDYDPLDMCLRFAQAGADLVHVVDLNGAREGEPKNLKIIKRLCQEGKCAIEFGGGVRSPAIARKLLDLGVARVVSGTALVQSPESAAAFFELGDKVVAGIDARDGMVAVEGWTADSSISAVDLAKQLASLGAVRMILTDISRDGMLSGPNTGLLREVGSVVDLPLIHSGGISNSQDVFEVSQTVPTPEAAIIGRAIYESRINLSNLIARYNN